MDWVKENATHSPCRRVRAASQHCLPQLLAGDTGHKYDPVEGYRVDQREVIKEQQRRGKQRPSEPWVSGRTNHGASRAAQEQSCSGESNSKRQTDSIRTRRVLDLDIQMPDPVNESLMVDVGLRCVQVEVTGKKEKGRTR